jgi:hypothetical protein
MYNITITEEIKSNFGKYKGVYEGKPKNVGYSKENGNPSILALNNKDTIIVDIEPLSVKALTIGTTYVFNGILRIAANNPENGFLINCTKINEQVT